jgi:hypothetical protein
MPTAISSAPARRALAIVGVGADEHAPARVIDDHLVEIAVLGAAQRAGLVGLGGLEGVILEIEADDLACRAGSHRCAVRAPRRKAGSPGMSVTHLGVVEFRDRRGVHHIAVLDLHRIGIGGGDMAVRAMSS